MSNVVLFTNGVASYLQSVNTQYYENDPNALINPDLSAVQGVDIWWWKRSGNSIGEMTSAEKQAVLDAWLEERRSRADQLVANLPEVLSALIKVVNLRLPGNKITRAELIAAIKAEIV